jgi:hypothetical protein
MQITPELSGKIKFLRLPLTIGIVAYHSPTMSVAYADIFFQNFMANALGGSCVHFFFIISGFLFFQNFNLSLNSYLEKLKSRFRTLLVPYLFWNLAVLAMAIIALNISATGSVFHRHYKEYIGDYSFANFIDCLMGYSTGAPIAFHLWYVRDLMGMVILSPVFLLVARKIPYLGLALFAAPWLLKLPLGFINIQWSGPLFGSLFFYLGCLIAVQKVDLTWLNRRKSLIIGIYLAMAVVLAIMRTDEIKNFHQHLFECCTRVVGTMAIWCASDLITGKLQKVCLNLSGLAFFVYAAHEPLLSVLKGVLWKLSKTPNSITVMVHYLLLLTIATLLTLAAASLLQKYTPKFFQVITGARG